MEPSSNQPSLLLERDVPLSQSAIWRMQRAFYSQRGLRAWSEDLVPQYITNNPFIAGIYARAVFAFLRDCLAAAGNSAPPVSVATPLRILELGAGPGKFSYLFLQRLAAMLHAADIELKAVRYFMTDSAAGLLEAWRANPYLAKFAESGTLRFEQFEAGQDVSAGAPLGQVAGPLVVIANYVFDSLPQDAFVMGHDRLLETLVTTKAPSTQPEKFSSLEFSYNDVSVAAQRYEDPVWNAILEQYRTRLPRCTVLFPAGTLKTLQKLSQYGDGRMLVLAADKGCVHEDTLRLAQGPPTFEMHASERCFSQMVNFDAIGRYFQATGGAALLPDKHSSSLSICGFLQGRPGDSFAATRAACQEALAAFGPDDLFALLGWLDPHLDGMTVPQILAVLRLSHWDPVALMRLFPAITRQVRSVTNARQDLRNAILNTWANHFPVTAAENALAFQCGVILLELRFFADALPMFQESQRVLGRSAPTSYNLGLCFLGLDRPAEALACMLEACELDPNFEPARLTRRKLEEQSAC